ncbi:SAV0927 family protein [Allobacillus sp. GCM10007491]|uniref:DUF3055 family protein n=1 Tax=Allobacillus saliphilus TaxID=2912308 RepID=A0A941CTJ8_9BACI|nr:SAV0927 family protein [Allobacillus saliphilus]MBR7553572.1 DUF3055 family protein [Allobacillus saliphilus]
MSKVNMIKDETENTSVRYVSFSTEFRRYDFAFFESAMIDDKVVIIDLQSSHYTTVKKDELKSPQYYAHHFRVNEYEAEEIFEYLKDTLK